MTYSTLRTEINNFFYFVHMREYTQILQSYHRVQHVKETLFAVFARFNYEANIKPIGRLAVVAVI